MTNLHQIKTFASDFRSHIVFASPCKNLNELIQLSHKGLSPFEVVMEIHDFNTCEVVKGVHNFYKSKVVMGCTTFKKVKYGVHDFYNEVINYKHDFNVSISRL